MITARLRNPTVTLEAPTNERQQEGVSLRVNVPPSKFLLRGEDTVTRRLRMCRRKRLIVSIPLSLPQT